MERKFKAKQVQINEHLMFRHGDSDDDEDFEEFQQTQIGWRSYQTSQLSALQQLQQTIKTQEERAQAQNNQQLKVHKYEEEQKFQQNQRPIFNASGLSQIQTQMGSNNYVRSDQAQNTARVYPLTNKYLQDLLQDNATNFSTQSFILFIRILSKLLQDNQIKQTELNIISQIIISSRFFQKLGTDYVQEVINTKQSHHFQQRLDEITIILDVIDRLADKFRTLIGKLPIPSFSQLIRVDIEVAQQGISLAYQYDRQVVILQEKVLKLDQKRIQIMQANNEEKQKSEQARQYQQMSRFNKEEDYKMQPPDDFQNIDVVPSTFELMTESTPFLRAMPQNGVFKDSHDYLDVVYRLLREDAIRPLREGVRLMLENKNQQLREAGIRLYDNVALQDLAISKNCSDVTITLRVFEKGKQNWLQSKKLLPGSLLILSSDNFKSMDFFLVCDRNSQEMARTSKYYHYAEITVQLLHNQEYDLPDSHQDSSSKDGNSSSDSDDDYYFYNVQQKYLKQRQKEARRLQREKARIERNSSPVLKYFKLFKSFSLKMIESTAYFESYSHVLRKIKSMDKWQILPMHQYLTGIEKQKIKLPKVFQDVDAKKSKEFMNSIALSMNKANFDKNQQEALETCMYNELAIIQGPPGTGKTYVGEHFVRILLETKEYWRNDKGPILLVCYTNHALDQFLNLIKKYSTNFRAYSDLIRDLEKLESQIKQKNSDVQLIDLGIMNSMSKQSETLKYPKIKNCIQMERKFKAKQVQINEHLMFRHGDSDDDEDFEEFQQTQIGWRSYQTSQLSALQQLQQTIKTQEERAQAQNNQQLKVHKYEEEQQFQQNQRPIFNASGLSQIQTQMGSNNYVRSDQAQNTARVYPLTNKYLQDLLQDNATNFSTQSFILFIRILSKLLQDNQIKQTELNIISQIIISSRFFQKLGTDYVQEVINTKQSHHFQQRLDEITIILDVIDRLADKFRTLIGKLPIPSFSQLIRVDIEVAQQGISLAYQYDRQVVILQEKVLKLDQKRIQIMQANNEEKQKSEQARQYQQMSRFNKEEDYKMQPPDDFQNIDVVPSTFELMTESTPFLRAMPQNGVFKDSHDYLDVVYRLLREDAIRPLREGVRLMLENKNQQLREAGIRLYDNVALQDLAISKNCSDVTITLRVFEKGKQNWLQSKKLLPGSLLILSSDNFKSMDFFLVCDRNSQEMARTSKYYHYAEITVQLLHNQEYDLPDSHQDSSSKDGNSSSDSDDDYYFYNVQQKYLKQRQKEARRLQREKARIERNSSPVLKYFKLFKSFSLKMIESTAYFESYSHVLRKIKSMDKWQILPMQQYLTGIQKQNIKLPKVFQDLLVDKKKRDNFINTIAMSINQPNFDENQREALKTCMFSELAIIQGPPGTGKTYVGEHFVRILLETKEYWRKDKGPILLVCYTNHALDQFLNLIKKYTTNFVRIGGRCKDENLMQYSVQQYIKDKNVKYQQAYTELIRDLEFLQRQIKSKNSDVQLIDLGIMNSMSNQSETLKFMNNVKTEFNHKITEKLKTALPGKYNEGYLNQSQQQFKKLQYKEPDIAVIFWLGIININKYIRELIERIKSGELDEDDDYIQYNEHDLGQREEDYDEDRNITDSNDPLQGKLKNLTQLYSIHNQSEFYNGCINFEQCIQKGKQQGSLQWNERSNENLFGLGIERRWQYNNYFAGNQDLNKFDDLENLIRIYRMKFQQKKELQSIVYATALNQADVVAMTTTGCAKNSELLKDVNFPIVIVEEAAEVFEGHILTALNERTEHLVLIGDHMQLRPSPAVYQLEKDYNLSMSMFERLVKSEFKYTTLTNQRRMRPEISQLVKFLYPKLTDDARVHSYPDIRGIEKNLFFMTHSQQEASDDNIQSKYNDYEANMIIKFTNYLIKQNYQSTQITILSLYQAQSFHIKNKLKQMFNDKDPINKVKVVTVDNFQGEENDIIILSLVRSNSQNNIGYLKVSNRVCVALSRAKHGMYIFGNSQCLIKQKGFDEQGNLWIEVLKYLSKNKYYGDTLNLCCRNHKTITPVKKAEDFDKVAQGGCNLICDIEMSCGHRCTSVCHNYQVNTKDPTGHDSVKCMEQCQRNHPCGHRCQYKCHECKIYYQPCKYQVIVTMPDCNHVNQINCSEVGRARCKVQCEKIKYCGHRCLSACSFDCRNEKCRQLIPKTLPNCGHQIEVKCSVSYDKLKKLFTSGCYVNCGKLLECGHTCLKACGTCSLQYFHGLCDKVCSRNLICGHACNDKCTKDCSQCMKICDMECKHKKCLKRCYEYCDHCEQKCQNGCTHQKCKNKCDEPCTIAPCPRACPILLECGHNCIGLCGDECPSICRECQPDHQAFDNFEDDYQSKFVQIDCGHLFESTYLDSLFKKNQLQEKGIFQIRFIECPRCNVPIKKCTRYYTYNQRIFQNLRTIKNNFIGITDKRFILESLYNEILRELTFISDYDCRRDLDKIMQEWLEVFKTQKQHYILLISLERKLHLISFMISFAKTFKKEWYYNNEDGQLQIEPVRKILEQDAQMAFQLIKQKKFIVTANEFLRYESLAKNYDETKDLKHLYSKIPQQFGLFSEKWFSCKKNHLFAVGNFDGSKEYLKCPKCQQAKIEAITSGQ
ncbi:nfx1-type zinc finger-containing protein 1-like [Stylonychia lemnae]|uniref:Nfx1-type zinc finger-containing protein 1-like n=1 Tax=Stylonychia lemnae TaxID=5949 RepID=A0A078A985_STYLE|nr:nfx1-type zinc finger-containing protein 1-like [Stylonychia lemnae]|eukprot:CDW78789.1 nfx1-type zinc finger-containing protein 1-like [Stylonychia lemnae]